MVVIISVAVPQRYGQIYTNEAGPRFGYRTPANLRKVDSSLPVRACHKTIPKDTPLWQSTRARHILGVPTGLRTKHFHTSPYWLTPAWRSNFPSRLASRVVRLVVLASTVVRARDHWSCSGGSTGANHYSPIHQNIPAVNTGSFGRQEYRDHESTFRCQQFVIRTIQLSYSLPESSLRKRLFISVIAVSCNLLADLEPYALDSSRVLPNAIPDRPAIVF